MHTFQIERVAKQMIQKYGLGALPMATKAAQYYLSASDTANADRWIKTGYVIKEMQTVKTEKQPEEV